MISILSMDLGDCIKFAKEYPLTFIGTA